LHHHFLIYSSGYSAFEYLANPPNRVGFLGVFGGLVGLVRLELAKLVGQTWSLWSLSFLKH